MRSRRTGRLPPVILAVSKGEYHVFSRSLRRLPLNILMCHSDYTKCGTKCLCKRESGVTASRCHNPDPEIHRFCRSLLPFERTTYYDLRVFLTVRLPDGRYHVVKRSAATWCRNESMPRRPVPFVQRAAGKKAPALKSRCFFVSSSVAA